MKAVVRIASHRGGRRRQVKFLHTCALEPSVVLGELEQQELRLVVDHYHRSLQASERAALFLESRRLTDPAVVEAFHLGLCDRSLPGVLPSVDTVIGGAVRGRLHRLGILRASGHEQLRGCLVVPVFDEAGGIANVYARRLVDHVRKDSVQHIALFDRDAGIFNLPAFSATRELVLCGSYIDALTFWCAGIHHVTATIGPMPLSAAYLQAIANAGVARVYIAYRKDNRCDRLAWAVARQLNGIGVLALRVHFPERHDANAVVMRTLDGAGALRVFMNMATTMTRGDRGVRSGACRVTPAT